MYVPSKIFVTRGVGKNREKITSFEIALRNANIASYNLVSVSSIYPPDCQLISISEDLKQISAGQILHAVISKNETNEPNRQIVASVGLAIPKDKNQYGYLSEHHNFGQTGAEAGDYAEDLAAEMLATILGVEFDADASWDEKRQQWKIRGKLFKTKNITQSAKGDKKGLWTT